MSLAEDWGVRDGIGEVTVWALLPADDSFSRHVTISTDLSPALGAELASGPRPSLDANGSRLDANINTTIDTNINADIDTNIDPDFDRELDFADLDELA